MDFARKSDLKRIFYSESVSEAEARAALEGVSSGKLLEPLYRGSTVLHYAATAAPIGVVSCVLEALGECAGDALAIGEHRDGATPLHMAAFNGQFSVVNALLECYATSDARRAAIVREDNSGFSALHLVMAHVARGEEDESIEYALELITVLEEAELRSIFSFAGVPFSASSVVRSLASHVKEGMKKLVTTMINDFLSRTLVPKGLLICQLHPAKVVECLLAGDYSADVIREALDPSTGLGAVVASERSVIAAIYDPTRRALQAKLDAKEPALGSING